jgi:hypothetical protein
MEPVSSWCGLQGRKHTLMTPSDAILFFWIALSRKRPDREVLGTEAMPTE